MSTEPTRAPTHAFTQARSDEHSHALKSPLCETSTTYDDTLSGAVDHQFMSKDNMPLLV